jgi:hypothetical protein
VAVVLSALALYRSSFGPPLPADCRCPGSRANERCSTARHSRSALAAAGVCRSAGRAMTRGNCTGQSRNGPHSWGERWTKVYENALIDTKYLAIADKTGAPRLLIGATFTELLPYTGTHHPDTGSFEGFHVRRR